MPWSISCIAGAIVMTYFLQTLVLVVALCSASLAFSAADGAKLPPTVIRTVDFVADIQPIFAKSCLSCHGPEKQKGSYRLDVKSSAIGGGDTGPNILPGKSAESPLIHYVAGLVPDKLMPAKGERLTEEQIGVLRAWIDQGANWPDNASQVAETKSEHWSFQPPQRPELPSVKDKKWPRNEIDRFILAKLEEKKLSPSPEADERTLIRRLKFDLLGLPPAPDEIDAFLKDKRSDAYEQLVEIFLASPHYGERWARHWLDVVRFAESHGFEMNKMRPNAWPYRDYVINAFNANKPYDRFITEQLAGDQLGEPAATAFFVAGPWDQVKSPDVALTKQQRSDELYDMISTTGSAFLGLTLGCARCHTHKFDPIPQSDYYAFQAIFSGVQHGEQELRPPDFEQRLAQAIEVRQSLSPILAELAQFEPLAQPDYKASEKTERPRPAVNARYNTDRFAPVQARFVRFTINQSSTLQPCIDELEIYTAGEQTRNVALRDLGAKATASSTLPNNKKHKLEHINDGQVGNDRSWISDEDGKGWVQIEFSETHTIDRVVWGRDRTEKFKDRLPTDYKIEVAVEPGQWMLVASSEDRRPFNPSAKPTTTAAALKLSPEQTARFNELLQQKKEIESRIKPLEDWPRVYAGRFEAPEPTFRLHRGDPMQEREPVAPGALTRIGAPLQLSPDTPEPQRRLALAKWITSGENPLTARVMVNRIWQYHFGEGLVKTPSDFGVNGIRPSNPALRAWLATEFVRRDWSVKEMHRLIVTSATYRQSSRPNAKAQQVDAGNELLWRYPPRRLEAEPLRDSILWASGKLDLKMGGPGFDLFEPNDNYVKVYTPKKEFGPEEFRRLIYQWKPRMQLDDTFGAFDCPDGGQIAPRRNSSTTPLQSLNLLNSAFILQQSGFLAERLEREAGNDAKAQVRRAFQLIFGREPHRAELAASEKLIREQGLPIFCRALFNANEFLYVF